MFYSLFYFFFFLRVGSPTSFRDSESFSLNQKKGRKKKKKKVKKIATTTMDQQLLDPSRHGGNDDGRNDDGRNDDGGNSDGGNSDVGSVENGPGYGTTVRHRREFSPTWKEAMDPRTSIPENSIKNTVFTLVSTIIGGGVLSLPWTFAVAGIGVGSAILLAISLLSAYSGNLLIACAVHSGGRSYEEIARLTFGAKMASFVNVQIFFSWSTLHALAMLS